MKVAVGADFSAIARKNEVKAYLLENGYEVLDLGQNEMCIRDRKSGKPEKYGRGSEAGDQHHFPGAEPKPVFECCGKYLSGKYT